MTWSLQDLGWSDKKNRVYYNGVKAKLVNVYKANPADNDLVGEIGLLYIVRKPSHRNQRPSSIRFAFIQEELNKGFFICVLYSFLLYSSCAFLALTYAITDFENLKPSLIPRLTKALNSVSLQE